MKANKTKELLNWIFKRSCVIEQPIMFLEDEILNLLEIHELELSNDQTLDEEIENFKSNYYFTKDGIWEYILPKY